MDLTPYLNTLREDLAAAAAAGDEQTQRTAAVLSAALGPAARLVIMNALADLAAEVTVALEDRIVEVRLDGRDVDVVVTDAPTHEQPAGAEPPPAPGDVTGDISRITLRMMEEIKAQAEQAAARQGVSLNAWVSQAVQGALQGRGRHRHGPWGGHWEQESEKRGRGGSRLQGWVES